MAFLQHSILDCTTKSTDLSFPWWRHQMETFSASLAFVRGIHRSPVNSPHKSQWCGALMFTLSCTWINDWANNREAGDLRRHRAHDDVIVMILQARWWQWLGSSCPIQLLMQGRPMNSYFTFLSERSMKFNSNNAFAFITITPLWARWRLKSPASPASIQAFIQAQIKENIKAPCHWP